MRRVIPRGRYLLGDLAYPLRPWLMPPFSCKLGHVLPPPERHYNKLQAGTRICVERAFGILKARWRLLGGRVRQHDKHDVAKVVTACTVLHNICCDRKEDETWLEDEWEKQKRQKKEERDDADQQQDVHTGTGEGGSDEDTRKLLAAGRRRRCATFFGWLRIADVSFLLTLLLVRNG